jgi:hypothetical protein
MPKYLKTISWFLALFGVACMAPRVSLNEASQPTEQDATIALNPIMRLPLDSLRVTGSASGIFEINGGRIAEAWGNPYYIIFSRRQHNGWQLTPFSDLGLHLQLTINGTLATLGKALRCPYAHSSQAHGDLGLRFLAKPGDQVRVDIKAINSASLPDGELVISPNWDIAIKDRLIGLMLDDDLHYTIIVVGWIGLILSLLGMIGLILSYRGAGRDAIGPSMTTQMSKCGE